MNDEEKQRLYDAVNSMAKDIKSLTQRVEKLEKSNQKLLDFDKKIDKQVNTVARLLKTHSTKIITLREKLSFVESTVQSLKMFLKR